MIFVQSCVHNINALSCVWHANDKHAKKTGANKTAVVVCSRKDENSLTFQDSYISHGKNLFSNTHAQIGDITYSYLCC